MNRKDFYFQQPVTEGELDSAFQAAEDAIDQVVQDLFLTPGIVVGGNVLPTLPASKAVKLDSAWRIRDAAGRRIVWGSGGQVVSLVEDHLGADILATAGAHKLASIFVAHDRSLSDPRTDGNGDVVLFARDESYRIIVVQGPETPIAFTPATPNPPVGYESAIRVADIHIVGDPATILTGDIQLGQQQKASLNNFGSDVFMGKTLLVKGSITSQAGITAETGTINGTFYADNVIADFGDFDSLNIGNGLISGFGIATETISVPYADFAPAALGPGMWALDPAAAGGNIYTALPDAADPAIQGKVIVIKRIGDSLSTSGYIARVDAGTSDIEGSTLYHLTNKYDVLQLIAVDGKWLRMSERLVTTTPNATTMALPPGGHTLSGNEATDTFVFTAAGDYNVTLPPAAACPGKKYTLKNFGPSEYHVVVMSGGNFDNGVTSSVIVYSASVPGNASAITFMSNGTTWVQTAKFIN